MAEAPQRLSVIKQTQTLTASSIGKDLRQRLGDWRGLLRANVQQGGRYFAN